jgi:hypothetical protein
MRSSSAAKISRLPSQPKNERLTLPLQASDEHVSFQALLLAIIVLVLLILLVAIGLVAGSNQIVVAGLSLIGLVVTVLIAGRRRR